MLFAGVISTRQHEVAQDSAKLNQLIVVKTIQFDCFTEKEGLIRVGEQMKKKIDQLGLGIRSSLYYNIQNTKYQ